MSALDVLLVVLVVAAAGAYVTWKLALARPKAPPVIAKGVLGKRRR